MGRYSQHLTIISYLPLIEYTVKFSSKSPIIQSHDLQECNCFHIVNFSEVGIIYYYPYQHALNCQYQNYIPISIMKFINAFIINQPSLYFVLYIFKSLPKAPAPLHIYSLTHSKYFYTQSHLNCGTLGHCYLSFMPRFIHLYGGMFKPYRFIHHM